MAMTTKGFITRLSGGTEVAGTLSIAAPGALYAVDFPRQKQKNPTSELLPPAAADRACRRRLTKGKEQETIIINRSGRSTYTKEKSVQTSGAIPAYDRIASTLSPAGREVARSSRFWTGLSAYSSSTSRWNTAVRLTPGVGACCVITCTKPSCGAFGAWNSGGTKT